MAIIPLVGTTRPSAHLIRHRACMYLAMAMELRRLALRRGRTPAYPFVRLFLRGRGLELSLKAFLLEKGCTKSYKY
jgi:hypothetical protein